MRSLSVRLISFFLALSCLIFLLSACRQDNTTPSQVLLALVEAEPSLPSGRTYLLSDAEQCPSNELLGALFGNGSRPSALDGVEDAAFYFSLTQPVEFSVFLCRRADETEAIAKLCLSRLEQLKNALPDQKERFDRATVTVRGRWVLLCVSSDVENALRVFRRAI